MWRPSILLLLLHFYVPATYGVLDEEQHYLSLERVRNIASTPTQPLPDNIEELRRLRRRLSQDAHNIVNALPLSERLYTTYVCVALKYQDQIKCFSFHNGSDEFGREAYAESNRRGYHAIQAERAHAEGQFLQYLFKNAQTYTHVVGIGCSRKYCPECDCLLSMLLGVDWRGIASAVMNASSIQIAESSMVDTTFCRLYKLPPILKRMIQIVVGQRLHFGYEFRFTIDRF